MKIYHNRIKETWHVKSLLKKLARQGIPIFGIVAFLTCTYYAGFWLGETSSYKDPYYDWRSSVTNEGFLEVSKILSDPRTTNDPMVGWFANKHQLQPDNNSPLLTTSTPAAPAKGVLQQMSALNTVSPSDQKLPRTKELFTDGWIRSAASACHGKKSPVVLLTVISAPDHIAEREAIRKSWGKLAAQNNQTAIVYLVGTPPDGSLENLLLESDIHGDLAVSSNVDTYVNLTLKTLSGFRWMQSFCPDADYILKTDDDMFIQTNRLRHLINGLRIKGDNPPVIVGNVASNWQPSRNRKSKYYISEDQYSESTYPPFVTGPSYLVSRSAVDKILVDAMEHTFIHLEDVFLTGIIAEQVGVPRRLATEFRNNAVPIPAKFLGCTLLRTISIHKVTPDEQMQFTKLARNPVCGGGKTP